MYWLIFVICIIVVLAYMVWASADIGSNVYLSTICKAAVNEKVISLTFDDGPDQQMTPKVLDILGKYGINATFFMIGRKAEKCPELVRRIVAEGHTVASHTYSHSFCFPLSREEHLSREVEAGAKVIERITNLKPRFFRPPFGVTNPIIGRVMHRMDSLAIGWSIRSLDTVSRRTRESVCKRVLDRLHPGAIILLHDRCEDADILLENLIISVTKQGYRFVSLSQMIGQEGYID